LAVEFITILNWAQFFRALNLQLLRIVIHERVVLIFGCSEPSWALNLIKFDFIILFEARKLREIDSLAAHFALHLDMVLYAKGAYIS